MPPSFFAEPAALNFAATPCGPMPSIAPTLRAKFGDFNNFSAPAAEFRSPADRAQAARSVRCGLSCDFMHTSPHKNFSSLLVAQTMVLQRLALQARLSALCRLCMPCINSRDRAPQRQPHLLNFPELPKNITAEHQQVYRRTNAPNYSEPKSICPKNSPASGSPYRSPLTIPPSPSLRRPRRSMFPSPFTGLILWA
jgi:hypothetical protein